MIRKNPSLLSENKEQSSLSKHCIMDQSQSVRARGLREGYFCSYLLFCSYSAVIFTAALKRKKYTSALTS